MKVTVRFDVRRARRRTIKIARELLERSRVDHKVEISDHPQITGPDACNIVMNGVSLGEGLGGIVRFLEDKIGYQKAHDLFKEVKTDIYNLVRPEEVTTSQSRFGKPDDKKRYFELALERGLVGPDSEFLLVGASIVLGQPYTSFTSEEAAQNFVDLFYSGAKYQIALYKKVTILQ